MRAKGCKCDARTTGRRAGHADWQLVYAEWRWHQQRTATPAEAATTAATVVATTTTTSSTHNLPGKYTCTFYNSYSLSKITNQIIMPCDGRTHTHTHKHTYTHLRPNTHTHSRSSSVMATGQRNHQKMDKPKKWLFK